MNNVERSPATGRRGDTYGGQSRHEREADRRERIMEAALQLFASRDYDDVTVADVCADAKVSKRYFYDYFADREELLYAVHRQQNDWLIGAVIASVPKDPNTVEAVLRPAMTTLVRLLVEQPTRGRVIYVNAPRMELRRRGVLRKDAQVLGQLVRRATGRPRDKVQFERVMLALTAGITEVVIEWVSSGMAGKPETLAEHLTGISVSMLRDR